MENICLKTDFYDYYDHWFDREGQIFNRFSNMGMSRKEMLNYMKRIGLKVPLYGIPDEIASQLPETNKEVVVYLDERAHRGEGKNKMPLEQAIQYYPNNLSALYIPNDPNGNGKSFRYLQVGDRSFWLVYINLDDWRSNYGSDVYIKVLDGKEGYHPKIHYPLFAIDFVQYYGCMGPLYAIDFNEAPGIKGTGIEKLLPAKEAVEAIKKAIKRKDG